MAVLTYEQLVAIGRVKQSALGTASSAGDLIRFNKLNANMGDPTLAAEDDADELGKGHEFAEESFTTSWSVGGSFDKYLTSEAASIFLAYALGESAVVAGAGTGSYVHTSNFGDPATDSIDMLPFTVLEQIRPTAGSGNVVTDRSLIGCVMEDVTLSVQSGPSRAASKIVANFVGTGKYTDPSGITMPAKTAENRLPSSSLALTINGTNYVTAKAIESLELTIKNNVRTDSGYFPGSGFLGATSSTGAIRGRMEYGKRQVMLKFVARLTPANTELTKLKAQTEGTCVFSLTGGLIAGSTYHKLLVTLPKVRYKSVVIEQADNIQTVAVECSALYDSSMLGPIECEVTNTLALVGPEV